MQNDKIKSIREALAGGYKKPDEKQVEVFQEALEKNEVAKNYLRDRGLNQETIKKFKLGFDQSRNSISIPVYKSGTGLVNIRYRRLDENGAKYSQEKGCEVWLYNDSGIEEGKKKGGVLVVEGEFDLMMCHQNGITNVVSPASGKDSYGVWIELLDQIKKVYIAYDNDDAGKYAGIKMADRIGIDKCYEVLYPEGIKDANDFFLEHTIDKFRELLSVAQPYYKHKFAGVGDIVDSLRKKPEERLVLDTVPFVKWRSNRLAVLAADSGGGKTTYALNIANELSDRDIPTLFFPFERGTEEVGERFLQVRYRKQEEDLMTLSDDAWKNMKEDAIGLPLYFSMPSQNEFFDTVRRAKRLFGIQFIIVDHLDYFVDGDNKVSKQADFIKKLKEFCIEVDVAAIVVHHISKDKDARRRKRKLSKEDLKGSSDIYQIAEIVILLYPGDEDNQVVIDIDKNKGPQGHRYCKVDMSTGRFDKPKEVQDVSEEEMRKLEKSVEEAWND